MVKWKSVVYELSGCRFESRCTHLTSDIAPVSSKEFFEIQATIECGFTLKHVRDIRLYSPIKLFLGISWVNVLSCPYEWQILNDYAAKLQYYRQRKHIKIRYLRRYSHMLYRITTLEKSERFDSLLHEFI